MKIVLGTMTFSDQADEATSLQMLHSFRDAGHVELDTAHQYNQGGTEKLLGSILEKHQDFEFLVATKVNPWSGDGLKSAEVQKQFNESLQRLQFDSVDLLYLHSPDLNTPIEDTLHTCWQFYSQGQFKRFGLSNFSAWQVAEVAEICKRNNWMTPTVYQGMYNALTRDVERELFPCLRNYEISFYAYNPLAGGLLTGKYKQLKHQPESGRFYYNKKYLARYWKTDYFSVLDKLANTCEKLDVTPTEVALRWMSHNSMMSPDHDDAIILGATKLNHLTENLVSTNGDPLPDEILQILDEGWGIIKPNCFKYFRP